MAINHERQQSCGSNQIIGQVMCSQNESNQNALSSYGNNQVVIPSCLNPASSSSCDTSATHVNVVSFQQQGSTGKKFNKQRKLFHCTYCNNNG